MVSSKFLKSSIIYTVSSTLSTLASFLLLPYYTNTRLLKLTDYGALSLYIGLALFIQIISTLSIDLYINTAFHEFKKQPEKLKSKIASLNGYILLAGVVVILLFAFGGKFFMQQYFSNPDSSSFRYAMMSVFTGVFMGHFRFYNSLLLNEERPWRYLWSNILNLVTTVFFSIFILYKCPLTLEGPMWGRLLSCASIFILSFIEVGYRYGIAVKREYLKTTFYFCFPLLITSLLQWVMGYSDRYIIKPILFNKELAIYDLSVRFTLLVSFLIDGVNTAISPRVFSMMNEKDNPEKDAQINKYLSSFNLLIMLIIPVNIFVLPIILPFFISDQNYLTAFMYFGIICSGFVTRGIMSVFTFPLYSNHKTIRLMVVNAVAAILQVILNYFMILHFKLYGAAFVLTFVKIFLVLGLAWACRDLAVAKFNIVKLIVLPAFVLGVICVMELFISSYGNFMHFIHLTELALIFIVTFFTYKNQIISILNKYILNVKKNGI